MATQGPLGGGFLPPRDKVEATSQEAQDRTKPFIQKRWKLRNGYWAVYGFLVILALLSTLNFRQGLLFPIVSIVMLLVAAGIWVPAWRYRDPEWVVGTFIAVLFLAGGSVVVQAVTHKG